jgi:hypothetical protein
MMTMFLGLGPAPRYVRRWSFAERTRDSLCVMSEKVNPRRRRMRRNFGNILHKERRGSKRRGQATCTDKGRDEDLI